jgi:hypothetical protein
MPAVGWRLIVNLPDEMVRILPTRRPLKTANFIYAGCLHFMPVPPRDCLVTLRWHGDR